MEHKAFLVHITTLNINPSNKMYPLKGAQIVYLKTDEAPTKVLSKIADFVDVFSLKLATKLSKHIEIHDYAFKFVDN